MSAIDAQIKVKVYKSAIMGTSDVNSGEISAPSGGVLPGSITAMSYKVFAAGESDKFATLESVLQTKHVLENIKPITNLKMNNSAVLETEFTKG
ncbi:hypothetical protein H0G86_010366 [Trichoderma simmonsii]|uniref:Uncharacterized protein n=1 Tax=Trichoderma simmonsii TaxID=1491479 RepID=A0A8G0LJD6_9HYPO|nr:hypothetical protein H0G86_010366 [Trichoderma simmonsii]